MNDELNLDHEVKRLAVLPTLEYETVREDEAKRLNLRVTILDKAVQECQEQLGAVGDGLDSELMPAPWPSPVKSEELLDEIESTIERFIICDEETRAAAALWITFTWFIDHVHVAPLAVITAPEKRCGKSQLLDLMGKMSRNALVAANISPAAIFRVIEGFKPTLLIDEVDTFLRANEEARGILNSGHTRSSAYVIRSVGDKHEPTKFSTWGAKALCGIGTLADTLMDRAITLELRRKLPDESVERLRHADGRVFLDIKSKLLRYEGDKGKQIGLARPKLPETLNDRAQDNWEPLFAIADDAGGKWPEKARKAALKLSGETESTMSAATELLVDIREIIEGGNGFPQIPTHELLAKLNADDLKRWATIMHGQQPMTPRKLAEMLKAFGIRPKNIRFLGAVSKGYEAKDFKDVFDRYLSSSSSEDATELQSNDFSEKSEPWNVANGSGMDEENATSKLLENKESSGAAPFTKADEGLYQDDYEVPF